MSSFLISLRQYLFAKIIIVHTLGGKYVTTNDAGNGGKHILQTI